MQSITLDTIEAIKGVWFDANRHERYYRVLRKRYQRWKICIECVKIPCASVAMVLPILLLSLNIDNRFQTFLLLEIPPILVYFGMDRIDWKLKLSTKHDVLDAVVSGCSLLHTETRELWYKIHSTGMLEHEASAQYQKLTRSLEWLLFVPDRFIPDNDRLRDICQTKAQLDIETQLTKRGI